MDDQCARVESFLKAEETSIDVGTVSRCVSTFVDAALGKGRNIALVTSGGTVGPIPSH